MWQKCQQITTICNLIKINLRYKSRTRHPQRPNKYMYSDTLEQPSPWCYLYVPYFVSKHPKRLWGIFFSVFWFLSVLVLFLFFCFCITLETSERLGCLDNWLCKSCLMFVIFILSQCVIVWSKLDLILDSWNGLVFELQ
jgi:hypothetical protein